ncbi:MULTISPECIES: sensor histidine kinase [Burkholderia]|uniref:sensor histidine kinase n=1 Tax=Burkholderia TaxID=32008 RepID=UPI00064E6E7C|nr:MULTISPECIES: HAMP domain-containing sensor histidine kinase [Burkholderia]KML22282.1 histidine kinase [Burkholderia cepacia]KMN59441.1 histidine kinase [Burkholderia sp. LK4]KVQ27055.1 histidine kinase [Burkholderia cepacia]KVV64649.1 histidine kinase [Burkholderia cepacia]KVV82821.1 histidine kinase [Burkholderia cepacia]
MKRPPFSTQLVMLWALVATLCATLVAVVWVMASSAEGQQIAGARAAGEAACEAVASRYDASAAQAGAQPDSALMHAILDIVLARAPDMEGGFWTAGGAPAASGFLAYSFPTYQGSGIKRDVPDAETPLILRTLRAAAATRATASNAVEGAQDAVIAAACPVRAGSGLFVWMLTRARPPLGRHGELLATGLAGVLAVILAIAAALAIALRRWKGNLARIEAGLAPDGRAPQLPYVGEPDLDRIIDAFNAHARRAEQLQQQAAELRTRLAQAERFGMLGKLAAQVAHEIRNPMGAMRLKAENALAGDSRRQQDALRVILAQIERIDAQLSGLLALTQPVSPHATRVDVDAWLAQVVDTHRELAQRQAIDLAWLPGEQGERLAQPAAFPMFDPDQMRRALDNLLLNALRHAGDGGAVTLAAARRTFGGRDWLRITVSDTGPGVPAEQRERIFEPFVTGRADGTGLGLAVVREVAAAHGGQAWLDDVPHGASFVIEIPWQPSS